MAKIRRFFAAQLFATMLVAGALPSAHAQDLRSTTGLCGPLRNGYGPFDYRTATTEQKRLVEGAHFPPMVETLREGHRGYLAGDIDYTLRAFPNHPRALSAMTRLTKREGNLQPPGATYPVECYYDRALRFRPDDPWPRILYVHYLIDNKREKEARIHLSKTVELDIEDPQLAYNVGLAYFSLGDYARSLEFAKRAYASGVKVPGLRDKLKTKGKWAD